jgi:hypothetical protein
VSREGTSEVKEYKKYSSKKTKKGNETFFPRDSGATGRALMTPSFRLSETNFRLLTSVTVTV